MRNDSSAHDRLVDSQTLKRQGCVDQSEMAVPLGEVSEQSFRVEVDILAEEPQVVAVCNE